MKARPRRRRPRGGLAALAFAAGALATPAALLAGWAVWRLAAALLSLLGSAP